MADVVGKMAVQLTASDKGLTQTLAKAVKSTKKTAAAFQKMKAKGKGFGSAMKIIQRSIKKLRGAMKAKWKAVPFKKMLAGAGAFVGARALVAKFQATMERLDKLGKTGAKLGIQTQSLAELGYAAQRSGIEVNTLEMSLQRMTRRVSEAALGTGEAQGALKELGLDAAMLTKMSPDQQLHMIADAFKNIKGPAERVRLAMKLFDSEGVAMINMLDGGSAGLSKMGARFTALTGQIDTASMEKYKDMMLDLKTAIDGAWIQIVQAIGPALTDWMQDLPAHVQKVKDFGDALRVLNSWNQGETLKIIEQEELARLEKLHGLQASATVDDSFGPVTEEHIRLLEVRLETIKKNIASTKEFNSDASWSTEHIEAMNKELEKTNKQLERRQKQLDDQSRREEEAETARIVTLEEKRVATAEELNELNEDWIQSADEAALSHEEIIAKLQKEADLLDEQMQSVNLTAEEYDKLHKKRIDNEKEYQKVQEKQEAAEKEAADERTRDAERAAEDAQSQADQWKDSFKTQADIVAEQADELKKLWEDGLLTFGEYQQGMQSLNDDLATGIEDLVASATSAVSNWESAADREAERSLGPEAIEAGSVAAQQFQARQDFMQRNPFGTVDPRATQMREKQYGVLVQIRDKLGGGEGGGGGGGLSLDEVGI